MKNLLSQIGKITDLRVGYYPEKMFNKPTNHTITEISITIRSNGEEEEAVKEFYQKLFDIQQKQSKKKQSKKK